MCDMPMYMTRKPKISPMIISALLNWCVSSMDRSSPVAKLALYPTALTAFKSVSGGVAASAVTSALPRARLTEAEMTPLVLESARSLAAEQAAQVIPSILI